MSIPDRRKRRRRSERSSIQILEEAFHLLRTVDVKYYWWFFVGAIPFAVGLLYFTADQSRSSLADQTALTASLVMALLYFWLRWCQSKFCSGLWDTVSPGNLPGWSGAERVRAIAALFLLHAFHLPLLLVGIFFAVPLGWIIAAQQNFTVLAATQNYGEKPLREIFGNGLRHSHFDWAQNHGVLLILCVVTFFTWMNIVATCLILPGFAKSFFGVESVFTISPTAAIMNTTFLLGSGLLTYLVMSPIMKAVYLLRCFYAESRHTGADLLSRLAACREARSRNPEREGNMRSSSRAAMLGLLLIPSLCLFGENLEAEDGSGVAESSALDLTGEEFRGSIGETMEQKKYQWQLSRQTLEGDAEGEENWLTRRINDIAKATRDTFKKFMDWVEEMFKKLDRDQSKKVDRNTKIDLSFFKEIRSTLSIGLILLVSGLVAWLVLLMYRKYKGKETVDGEGIDQVDAIDLRSEEIIASQLPEDEWMRLAREQISKGDSRLAVRALFLATLAKLGEEGLLRIAKFKSNRDYRNELERKARKSRDLLEAFRDNTRIFERAWYGWHAVSENVVESFLNNHEIIAHNAAEFSRLPEPQTTARQ